MKQFALGLVSGVIIALVVVTFGIATRKHLVLETRPLDKVYAAVIAVDIPGKPTQGYFEWCHEGYFMVANGFELSSSITMVRDERCESVR